MSEVENGVESAQDISKNAAKKAAKAAEAAQKKAAKDAEKATKLAESGPAKVKIGGDDGEDLDPTQYFENRLKSITAIEVLFILHLFFFAIITSHFSRLYPYIAKQWPSLSSQV